MKNLPLHLRIDLTALEKSFYELSRRLHPDRFAAKSAEEQAAALGESSRLNDAYRTLKDPIARTEYLLKLEGVEMEEQSKSATEAARATGTAKKQIVPEDLLEEAFELNMQLEEMRMAKKMGEDDPQLRTDLLAAKAGFDAKMATTQAELETLRRDKEETIVELRSRLDGVDHRPRPSILVDRCGAWPHVAFLAGSKHSSTFERDA